MQESFGTYLYRKRTHLSLLGSQRVTQDQMAQYLTPKLTEAMGRSVVVRRQAYNKWEKDQTVPPYHQQIREVLGK